MKIVLLLIASNIFMTLAWYGDLTFKESPTVLAIFAMGLGSI